MGAKWIFLNEIIWISIKISLKFVPRGPINNIPALVQIMAWRRPGDKPLSEPMMVSSLTHVCVTRPEWYTWSSKIECQFLKKIWNFFIWPPRYKLVNKKELHSLYNQHLAYLESKCSIQTSAQLFRPFVNNISPIIMIIMKNSRSAHTQSVVMPDDNVNNRTLWLGRISRATLPIPPLQNCEKYKIGISISQLLSIIVFWWLHQSMCFLSSPQRQIS